MPRIGSSNTSPLEDVAVLAERFGEAWRRSGSTDLAEFLPAADSALRKPALHRLIETEMELRYQRREQVFLEQYLERFPELGHARDLPAPLICAEYRLRLRYGAQPVLQGYGQRFPEQFAVVQ